MLKIFFSHFECRLLHIFKRRGLTARQLYDKKYSI